MSDVTHRKRGLRFWGFEKKQSVEFLPPNEKVEIQTWARPDDFVRHRRRALIELRADDVKAVSIERLCVSLSSSRKTFNSKVIKFRTWTNFVFSDSYICLCTFDEYVHFTYSYLGSIVDLDGNVTLQRIFQSNLPFIIEINYNLLWVCDFVATQFFQVRTVCFTLPGVGVVCHFCYFCRCASVIYGYCSLNYSHHKYNTKHYNRAKEME